MTPRDAGSFDPARFQAVRRPLDEAETLPPSCYTSAAFHARERDEIFMKTWHLVGLAADLPGEGDYRAMSIAGVGFVVVRDGDGALHAFANHCRHRGARLLEGAGSCRRIVCPYHGWTYRLDGGLAFANGMENAIGFDPGAHGLIALPLAVRHGFLFVNFDPDCAPVDDYLGDLGRHIACYRIEDMVTVRRSETVVRTNWKSYVENSMESFHHATVHRDSVNDPRARKTVVVGDPGQYLLVQTDLGGESRALLRGDAGFPSIPTLTGAAARGSQYFLVYPCAMVGCDVDSMWYKRMLPEGPDRVRNVVAVCFPRETAARPDFEEVARRYYRRFDVTVAEDDEIAERQFAGLSSPLARPGRFSHREPLVHVIDNWVLDRVLDARR